MAGLTNKDTPGQDIEEFGKYIIMSAYSPGVLILQMPHRYNSNIVYTCAWEIDLLQYLSC